MKGTSVLVASVVASSVLAVIPGGRDVTFKNPCANKGEAVNSRGDSAGKEKYAPRFDGLRFIETLVTAHR